MPVPILLGMTGLMALPCSSWGSPSMAFSPRCGATSPFRRLFLPSSPRSWCCQPTLLKPTFTRTALAIPELPQSVWTSALRVGSPVRLSHHRLNGRLKQGRPHHWQCHGNLGLQNPSLTNGQLIAIHVTPSHLVAKPDLMLPALGGRSGRYGLGHHSWSGPEIARATRAFAYF